MAGFEQQGKGMIWFVQQDPSGPVWCMERPELRQTAAPGRMLWGIKKSFSPSKIHVYLGPQNATSFGKKGLCKCNYLGFQDDIVLGWGPN